MDRIDVLKNLYKKELSGLPQADAGDILFNFGNPCQALLYSMLFMPELIEIAGSVVLGEKSDRARIMEAFEAGLARGIPVEELEASFNFVEVGCLFAKNDATTVEQDFVLGCEIAKSWDAWLMFKFPDRAFKVWVEDEESGGAIVSVHFNEISLR